MAEYIPAYVGTVTKYVFVESPTMTPGELALRAYEVSEGVLIKETCFGLQVTGEPETRSAGSIPITSLSRTGGSRPATRDGAGRTSAERGRAISAMSGSSGFSAISPTALRNSTGGGRRSRRHRPHARRRNPHWILSDYKN